MEISINEVLKLENPNIIDIRSIENYNSNHIPGARNISYNDLLIRPGMFLNKTETYYIYCKKGRTSRGLCQLLSGQGYKVISIIGGYESWILNN